MTAGHGGQAALTLKAHSIGIPLHELNIDPAQAGGLLGKFDALVGRIKVARSCRGDRTFQFSRLRSGTPFEHLLLVARSRNPTDWTDLHQLDHLFWLGYVSRAAFDRALAGRRRAQRHQASIQAQRHETQTPGRLGPYLAVARSGSCIFVFFVFSLAPVEQVIVLRCV